MGQVPWINDRAFRAVIPVAPDPGDSSELAGHGMTLQSARSSDAHSLSTCATVRTGDDHDVVALSGELDIQTAPQLSLVIQDLLTQGRKRVTLNLDDVTFMDGYALGVLIAAHRDVTRVGGCLDITHNPVCARLLVVTGTTTFLDL